MPRLNRVTEEIWKHRARLVREVLEHLSKRGVTDQEIAAGVKCSTRTVARWRDPKSEITATPAKWVKLKSFAGRRGMVVVEKGEKLVLPDVSLRSR